MDKYAIYTYKQTAESPQEGDLFEEVNASSDGSEPSVEKMEWLFGDTRSEFRVQKNGKDGADKFPCTVLAHDHHVVLLRLENVKNIPIYVKSKAEAGAIAKIDKQNVTSNPYSYVIIDFDKERRLIAIQQDSDSWRNTDAVCGLLEESINEQLNARQLGFNIKICSKMQTREFWEYSSYRIKKEHKRLKKMTIYFDAGKVDPRVEMLVKRTPFLRNLLKELWGGSHGEVTIYDPVSESVIDRRKHAIENLVTIITSDIPNNRFGLKMTYNDDVTYTCGKFIQVELPLDGQYLTEFQLGSKTLADDYNLEQWLYYVIEQTKGLSDVEAVKRKPGGKSKRKVS